MTIERVYRRTYNIGDKIGDHKIIEYCQTKKRGYLVICDLCKFESIKSSTQLKKAPKCRHCNVRNLVGNKKNKIKFLEYLGDWKYKCLCDCGKEFIGRERQKSCGCHKMEDLVLDAKKREGITFSGIKILKYLYHEKRSDGVNSAVYNARCKCGKVFLLKQTLIFRIKSCGCRINSNMANGERQGNSKYTEVEISSIRELFLTGHYTKEQLSEMFNMPLIYIADILRFKSWKHVKVDQDIINNSPIKEKFCRKPTVCLKIGEIFGQWTVLKKAPSRKNHGYHLCQCTCGTICEVLNTALRHGKSTKCINCSIKNLVKSKKSIHANDD